MYHRTTLRIYFLGLWGREDRLAADDLELGGRIDFNTDAV